MNSQQLHYSHGNLFVSSLRVDRNSSALWLGDFSLSCGPLIDSDFPKL